MIELKLFLIIGKARAGDFTVLWPEQTPITSQSARLAASWLQIHVTSATPRSAVLWRQDGHMIAACAWQESGVDGAGRPLHRLVAYTVPSHQQTALARLALWVYRQNFGDGRPPATLGIGAENLLDDDPPLDAYERDCGAAALALLAADVCRAQSTRTAQAIIDAVGFEQLGFVALLPNAVASWPAAGSGVTLSRAAWEAPADVARMVDSGLGTGAVDLAGLMRLPKDTAHRRALADAALSGVVPTVASLSDKEIEWLLVNGRARASALAAANADQIARLVASAKIDLADVEGVSPERLRKLPPAMVANAWRGRSDAIARFVAAFGRGLPDIAPLFSDRAAGFIRASCGAVATPQRGLDIAADEINQMEQAGLLDTMSLSWLAALRAIHPHAPVEDHFADRLRGFIPEPLVSHLLGAPTTATGDAGALAARHPSASPGDWLGGITFARLVEVGALCMADRAWRRWWADALRQHPDAGKYDVASVTAPWSRETTAWLAASVRDGEISSGDVLARLAAFVAARAPMTATEIAELLAACGLAEPDRLACVVQGRSPHAGGVDDGFAAGIQRLLDAGVLSEDALQQAVRDGLAVTALAQLGADTTAVALLQLDQLAPTAPPTGWTPFLTTELRRRMHDPRFWARWRRGVPVALLAWLSQRVGGTPEEILIEALHLASERSTPLAIDELRPISGAVAGLDLAWQIVEHCKRGDTDCSALIGLVDDSAMRPELANFLRSELGALASAVPVPELTAAELLAIHPLLHPVRDVVRQIMARPTSEPAEDLLLPPTIAAIRRMGPAPSPPPPSVAQATRRPAWVAALSALPGWERWRHPTS